MLARSKNSWSWFKIDFLQNLGDKRVFEKWPEIRHNPRVPSLFVCLLVKEAVQQHVQKRMEYIQS